MKGKNRYIKKAHISERKFKEILQCFCLDLTAKQTSEITKVNRNTINRYFNLINLEKESLSSAKQIYHFKEKQRLMRATLGQRGLRAKEEGGKRKDYRIWTLKT